MVVKKVKSFGLVSLLLVCRLGWSDSADLPKSPHVRVATDYRENPGFDWWKVLCGCALW